MPPIPLSKYTHVFIVGIKGVAMTGIATILSQMGKKVSGSDTHDHQITDRVISNFQFPISNLDADLPASIDLVVYSAAHGGVRSPQVTEALEKGIQVMHQAEIIQAFIQMFPTSIAICGCHGKTGTTSLTVYTLLQLGARVSWLIGAPEFSGSHQVGGQIPNSKFQIPNKNPNDKISKKTLSRSSQTINYQLSTINSSFPGAHYDPASQIFVFEADEYGVCPPVDLTPKLEYYTPTHIICTNIDFDHPDMYTDLAHTTEVFQRFFAKSSHVYQCHSTSIEGNKTGIIPCLGDLGYAPETVVKAMSGYQGTKRRLEHHGEAHEVDFYDDYGHHPAEILATIEWFRTRFPSRRLIVLFQSHTYSRTQSLKYEFVDALARADIAYIDQIFPSAREKPGISRITAGDLEKIAKEKGHAHITGFETRADLVAKTKSTMRPGDIILTMGAGDIYKIIEELELEKYP